jgi:5-methylcytosine-specific restriction endonuclease McrA
MPGDPFYKGERWKETQKAFIKAHPTCSALYCDKPAVCVDHIKSRRKGGADYDWNNLAQFCWGHHSQKTCRVDGGFGRSPSTKPAPGCDVNGMPTAKDHPWSRGGG